MAAVKNTKKQRSSRQILRRRHFPPPQRINHSSSQVKPALAADQEAFDFEQQQNRGWLHSQMNLPESNGITKWQHSELLRYFSKPTLAERERAPLLREGLKLSIVSQQHLARLTQERNNEKQKLGLALNMTTHVEDWWIKGPIPASREGKKAGEKRPRPENRKAKRIRNFMERKDQETAQKAIARKKQVIKDISRMQIGDEAAEANATNEEGEEYGDEEVAMECIDKQKDERIAPHRWVEELAFRETKP